MMRCWPSASGSPTTPPGRPFLERSTEFQFPGSAHGGSSEIVNRVVHRNRWISCPA